MANIIRCKKDIAVIGAGHWGKNHIRILNEKRRLHTICEKKPPHEWEFTAPDAVGWVDELEYIKNNPQIKGVIIATPAESHFQIGMEMLKSGKHCLIEKPLAMSEREGMLLRIEAEEQKRRLMVGHLLRFHNGFIQALDLTRDNAIGKLKYVYANRLNLGRIRKEENVWWSFAPHDISMILALVKEEPEEVWAKGWHGLERKQADSTMTCMSFRKGINAHVYVSWLHPFKRHELVCIGEKGMLVFNDCEAWEKKLCLYRADREFESCHQEYEPLAPREPLRAEIDHFLKCCDSADRNVKIMPETDAEEGIKVLRVLEQAQQSMEVNSGGK